MAPWASHLSSLDHDEQLSDEQKLNLLSTALGELSEEVRRRIREYEIADLDHPFIEEFSFQGVYAGEWTEFADLLCANSRTSQFCRFLVDNTDRGVTPEQFAESVFNIFKTPEVLQYLLVTIWGFQL